MELKPQFNIFNDWLGLDDPFRDDDRLDPRTIEKKEREQIEAIRAEIIAEGRGGSTQGGASGGSSAGEGDGMGGLGALFQPPLVYVLGAGVAYLALKK